MGIVKTIKELKKDVAEIKVTLVGESFTKSKKLNEVLEDLSNIQLKVKSITETVDYNGRPVLKISYEIPQVFLVFDDEGNVQVNETFRAINDLDLIDMEDKMKLIEKINKKKI